MAREGQREPWWARYRDLLPAGMTQYLNLETAADRIRSYAPQVIPELLQTPDYATAACRASRPGLTNDEIEVLVNFQLERQELMRASGRQVHLIIDELALTRGIAPASLIAAQLGQLLHDTQYEAVNLQVITAQPDHPVISPAFTLLDIGHQASPAGYSYGPAGQVTIAKGRTAVQAMETIFGALTRTARSPRDTASLIEEACSRTRRET
jgi:hypothetical protein